MARLIQLSGPDVAPATVRKAEVSFGRDRGNDYQINDPSTSRFHAKIVFERGHYLVQDLSSRNGTFVNGEQIQKSKLSSGDRVRFGDPEFEFLCPAAETEPALTVERSTETAAPVPRAEAFRPVASTQEQSIGPETAELKALRRDHDKLMLLYEVGKDLHSALEDPSGLMGKALDVVFKVLEAKRAFIATVDRDTGNLVYEVVRDRDGNDLDLEKGIPVSRTITHDVVRNRRAILTRDAVSEEAYRSVQSIADTNLLSAMCVPLLYREEALGILYADNHAERNCFSPADLEFCASLGHLVGIALGNATLYRRVREERAVLIESLGQDVGIIGKSPKMQAVYDQIERVAPTEASVLITGESGTGKELVARAIHQRSKRKNKPFVPVNCAAIPETLLESELFGYAPNSGISGASPKGKPGKFELAHGGTIFLDEIGDMNPATQAKILRVVQDRRVERLSATEPLHVDVRILSATNRTLSEEIEAGRFREDLYYRLKVVQIHVPPLRERREDIPDLVDYFVKRACARNNCFVREVQAKAMDLIQGHGWPGNVRELENAIEAAVVMAGGPVVTVDLLSERVRQGRKGIPSSLPSWVEEERQYLLRVLRHCKGVKSRAAEITGLARKTIHEKIKQHALKPPDWGGSADEEPPADSPGARGNEDKED